MKPSMKKPLNSFLKVCIVCISILTACKSQEKKETTASGETVPFEVLLTGPSSNMQAEEYRLISASEDLLLVVVKINQSVSPPHRLPMIDFSANSVVLLNMGQQSTGGYSYTVERVIKGSDSWVVEYRKNEPGAGEMAVTAITTPYTIIKIPRPEAALSFREITD